MKTTLKIHIGREAEGRLVLRQGEAPRQQLPPGRIPRISRLMALAIRMDGLVRDGESADYASIARAGHVSRARVSQIVALSNLAPDIQEEILHLPLVCEGRDPIREGHVRPILRVTDWREQRKRWIQLSQQRS